MKIRPYENKDREYVRFICLNSEGPCDLNEEERQFILTTYCDYYIEKETENCFVAVDNNDKAVGYIICAENYDRFIKTFTEEYIPRLSSLHKRFAEAAKKSTELQNKHKKEFPAHLHIDLLPEYQRMGIGTKLVDKLCGHLKGNKIHGVMLTVGSSNNVGKSFYKKYGFIELDSLPGEVAFGIRL